MTHPRADAAVTGERFVERLHLEHELECAAMAIASVFGGLWCVGHGGSCSGAIDVGHCRGDSDRHATGPEPEPDSEYLH